MIKKKEEEIMKVYTIETNLFFLSGGFVDTVRGKPRPSGRGRIADSQAYSRPVVRERELEEAVGLMVEEAREEEVALDH